MNINDIYKTIILETVRLKNFDETTLMKIKRQIAGAYKLPPPASSKLILAYHELVRKHKIEKNQKLEHLLIRRKVRTISGVAIVTNLTKPYPCPGKCTYCPTEARMPKSYLSSEPAAARALRNRFDPYKQTTVRLKALQNNNHNTDKIELIIKGGTWSFYPKKYQNWFIKRCFDACNDFNARQKVASKTLNEAQKKNETAKNRIIGLTLETRPDYINPEEIQQLRKLGCTRIELGVQIIDDKILKLVKRGHTIDDVIRATKLLKDAGFKTDYHIMPMLEGSTPANDLKRFKQLFNDSRFRPDMIKIYPCSVIKNSILELLYKQGQYKPYSKKKLFSLLIEMKKTVPRYVRISRIIRDIPTTNISAGSMITNLREELQKELKRLDIRCKCIRCREVGHQLKHFPEQKLKEKKLFVEKYVASDGLEYFLSIEDGTRNVLYAFCRLRLPSQDNKQITQVLPELKEAALIRELHTYGHLIPIHEKNIKSYKNKVQHLGMGRQLMKKAESIAKQSGYKKMAVISGIGVREYYRKLGYRLKGTYMLKYLK